jgi:mannose-6-phosphate isomerase-like protein (cupin superfamily)
VYYKIKSTSYNPTQYKPKDVQVIMFFDKEKFIKNSPHPQPIVPIPYDEFAPTIHSDAVDGFFIQNDGETLWRIFRNTGVEQHVLKSGDMMYIPKNIIHSVESLTPRHSVSIAFEDPKLNACPRCGHQNN